MDKPSNPAPRSPGATSSEPRYEPNGGINRGAMAAAAVLIVLALGGGWWWWTQRQAVEAVPVATPAPEPAPAAAPAPSVAAPAPAAIQNPIEAPVAAAPTEPLTLDKSDAVIAKALTDLLGSKAVASMLRTDDFVRRAVATVDGMGRAHAAPRLWPVNPAAGRFSVVREGDADVIAPANGARYATLVGLAESVDIVRAAALYKQNYPLFQSAYKELGYPDGYFNDRMVQVLDQLLATPEPTGPLAVRLIEVKGEVASTQPWTRYEYVDPKLEALSAGQKALLRMGPDNARRVKAKLRALRTAVAKAP